MLFGISGEQNCFVLFQKKQKHDAKYAAGNDFADANGDHKIVQSTFESIYIGKNRRDKQYIENNRREWR